MDNQKKANGCNFEGDAIWTILKGRARIRIYRHTTYGGGYVDPTLEIFLKEYDFGKQSVPNNSDNLWRRVWEIQ